MRKENPESPFLDQIDDVEDSDSVEGTASPPIRIHADVRRALEVREEMMRLREDLAEFGEELDDLDDILDN